MHDGDGNFDERAVIFETRYPDLVLALADSSAHAQTSMRARPRVVRSRRGLHARDENRGSRVRASYARNHVGLRRVQRRDKHQEAASARPGIASERAFESYSYDLNGNRTSSLNSAGVFSATFDAQDRIESYGTLTFVYDGGENMTTLMVTTGATYRFVKDERGSVRQLVDDTTGNIVDELTYDSWGRVLGDSSPGFQPFGFAGGFYDPNSGS